jgi:hypothetical protein
MTATLTEIRQEMKTTGDAERDLSELGTTMMEVSELVDVLLHDLCQGGIDFRKGKPEVQVVIRSILEVAFTEGMLVQRERERRRLGER